MFSNKYKFTSDRSDSGSKKFKQNHGGALVKSGGVCVSMKSGSRSCVLAFGKNLVFSRREDVIFNLPRKEFLF